MEDIRPIQKVSGATKSAITRKSAQTLPNNPSQRGMSADEIKRRFYQPILDAANSALAEIDRVVEEANEQLANCNGNLLNFIEQSSIKEPYKLDLTANQWAFNNDTKRYEIVIDAATHEVEDFKDIGVDMYLIDPQGRYIKVNQYEIYTNGNVVLYHESQGVGHINIYTKRDGYILGTQITKAENVFGLARVGLTNNYNDLDGTPDTSQIETNQTIIAKMIQGQQVVAEAQHADTANFANSANSATTAEKATNADYATKATQDKNGVDIADNYVRKDKTYNDLTAGKATKATGDEDGSNIKATYARKDGNYSSMTVGKAANADNATNAASATKANQDINGAVIHNTYAKQGGTYSGMTVGKANNADNATKATNDSDGNKISSTYLKSTTFSNESQTKLGDCVICKKVLISNGGTAFGNFSLSKNIAKGDIIEINLKAQYGHTVLNQTEEIYIDYKFRGKVVDTTGENFGILCDFAPVRTRTSGWAASQYCEGAATPNIKVVSANMIQIVGIHRLLRSSSTTYNDSLNPLISKDFLDVGMNTLVSFNVSAIYKVIE